MCLTQPGLLVAVEPDGSAVAIVDGEVRQVLLVAMDSDAKPGDWVLLQAGLAVTRIDAREAKELLRLLDKAKEANQ